MVIVIISFLSMLFSSGENGYRTAYWGAVYFESIEKADSAISMTAGIDIATSLIVDYKAKSKNFVMRGTKKANIGTYLTDE